MRRTGRLLTPSSAGLAQSVLLTPSMPVISSAVRTPPASLVPGAGEEVAQPQVPLPRSDVRFVQHAHLAAAVALEAQEPRGEGVERLAEAGLYAAAP